MVRACLSFWRGGAERVRVCVSETSYIPKVKESLHHEYYETGIACLPRQPFLSCSKLCVGLWYLSTLCYFYYVKM